jgi:hypothetical protein
MRAGSNGRDAIGRFDPELDAATIDFGYSRSRDDLPADRRGRQMQDVHARSHRTFLRSKEGLDGVKSSVLHGHDHDRCRQYRWQSSVLEAIGKVFSGYHQRERTPGSYWYRRHEIAPRGPPR